MKRTVMRHADFASLLLLATCTSSQPRQGVERTDPPVPSVDAKSSYDGPRRIDPATLSPEQRNAFAGWIYSGVGMELKELSGAPGHQVAHFLVFNESSEDLSVKADDAGRMVYQFEVFDETGWKRELLVSGFAFPRCDTLPHNSRPELGIPIEPTWNPQDGRSRVVLLVRNADHPELWWSLPSAEIGADAWKRLGLGDSTGGKPGSEGWNK